MFEYKFAVTHILFIAHFAVCRTAECMDGKTKQCCAGDGESCVAFYTTMRMTATTKTKQTVFLIFQCDGENAYRSTCTIHAVKDKLIR